METNLKSPKKTPEDKYENISFGGAHKFRVVLENQLVTPQQCYSNIAFGAEGKQISGPHKIHSASGCEETKDNLEQPPTEQSQQLRLQTDEEISASKKATPYLMKSEVVEFLEESQKKELLQIVKDYNKLIRV